MSCRHCYRIASIAFFGLFLLFGVTKVYATNLKGEWQISGLKLKAEQSGDTFSLIVIDPDVPEEYSGIAILKGTTSGNTFTGQGFVVAKECPNLNGYKPSSGTISNTEINSKTIVSHYDPDACTEDPGSETEVSDTFTKILSPEEKALQDYQSELTKLNQDFANRPGPIIDYSNATIVNTSPVEEENNNHPINVAGWSAEDTQPAPSDFVSFLGNIANVPPSHWGSEIARISNFEGSLTLHQSYNGESVDSSVYKTGTSIHHNVLYAGDTFSFEGDGFIQYNGIDGSVKQFMTAGYAATHGYQDQIKSGQAGLEITLKPADPPLPPVAPPGPIRQFLNWLGELLTPEPQPTPYGIAGVKG